MADKLEAGKTYKLVDKNEYITRLNGYNMGLYKSFFKDETVTIEYTKNGHGYVGHWEVISKREYHLFELVDDYESLQTISSPFGELDKQTKKDLLCAWVDDAEIEAYSDGLYYSITNPQWVYSCKYRVKPTISAKEAAKAKLISEAQQQLRDAQEALDKAQQL